jgi:hypothetical protein
MYHIGLFILFLPATSCIDRHLIQLQVRPSWRKATYLQECHQELDGRILRDL